MILSQEAETTDPLLEYVLLGDDISQGIFAWISVGIDASNVFNVSAAATLTKDGGVANPNAGMGGGPGGPNGTFPSGGPPSGVPTGTPPA